MEEKHVEQILERLRDGDETARDQLLDIVYQHLRGMAARHLAKQRDGHTLQPTALVNEAYLKLFRNTSPDWNDRAHFLRAAAAAMRTILVDHARARRTAKRAPEGERVSIDGLVAEFEHDGTDLAALGEAIERLELQDRELAQLVELKFFGGYTFEETARLMGISQSKAVRSWQVARAWLKRELESA